MARPAASRTKLAVCLGQAGIRIGDLTYAKAASREYSSFAYDEAWRQSASYFAISPDLEGIAGHQTTKAASKDDSCFFRALADTEPDAWGRRLVARAHAKARSKNPGLGALTELDYLCAVDDFSRIGALRLRDASGQFLRPADQRPIPPLVELEAMFEASRAVERSQESAADLNYLLGRGTSLGGMRPKCTVLDADGSLAIGKFPSIHDARSVTRGEVLAMCLAENAGIEVAAARIVPVKGVPVAVIRRFDRTDSRQRIPYLSAASMLQASRAEDRAYTEVVDQIVRTCADVVADAQQLWRRLVFNHLITNTDDHLHNLGFLYAGNGRWRLAPAFDLNPFPDKDRESKTWLSADTGPITAIGTLLAKASFFHRSQAGALAILAEVCQAIGRWRTLALGPRIGLTPKELDAFAPAFEHSEIRAAQQYC